MQAPCSTQLSTKFILLINVKMPTIVGILTFMSIINTTSERHKARNFFICRYFSFYEQLKFCAQSSWAWKKFYNLGVLIIINQNDLKRTKFKHGLNFNYSHTCGNKIHVVVTKVMGTPFWCLLITFANSLDPDKTSQNIKPDLDPNCLTLWWYSCQRLL